MTSIVAAYARQRLADMEELQRDLGPRRPTGTVGWGSVRREVWSAVLITLSRTSPWSRRARPRPGHRVPHGHA